VSDPKGGYFAWRTNVAKRDSFPDIDYAVELILRECWSAAYNLGRKDGVLKTADLRSAADAYRDFVDLLERWQQEQLILLATEANA
jgi:hypothetical protein